MTIRVLYLNETSEIAGTANSLIRLVEHLDRERFTPLVACPPGPLADRIGQLDVDFIPFVFHLRRLKFGHPDRAHLRPVNPIALLWKFWEGVRLAVLCRQQEIDVIHSNSLSAHIVGLVATRLTRTAIVWHIRSVRHPPTLYRLLRPDAIVFVSDSAKRTALPREASARTFVIPNGEDPDIFNPATPRADIRPALGLIANQPLAAIIARLDPFKRHGDLIQAWQTVVAKIPKAQLLIVGDEDLSQDRKGTYRHSLERMVGEYGLENNIVFTGHLRDIPDILHVIDVNILTTDGEANPRSVIEAMLMGKPTIAIRSGGMPEMIVDGETGLLVERGDISGLAEAIARLLEDRDLREAMGKAAHVRALQTYTIDRHVMLVQEVYAQVLTQDQEDA